MERIIFIDIDDTLDGREIKYILRERLGVSSRLTSKLKAREDGILLNGEKAYVAVTCEEAEEEVSLKLLGLEKAKVNYYFIDETHNLELVRKGSFSGRAINLKMPRDSAYILELEL